MAIIRWEPFGDNPLDNMLRFVREMPTPEFNMGDLAADIYEENGQMITKLNLPGMKPENININVSQGILTVEGAREEISEEDEKNYYRREIRRGNFSRSFRVPEVLKAEDIKADYTDGILTLSFANVSEPMLDTKVKLNQGALPEASKGTEAKEDTTSKQKEEKREKALVT